MSDFYVSVVLNRFTSIFYHFRQKKERKLYQILKNFFSYTIQAKNVQNSHSSQNSAKHTPKNNGNKIGNDGNRKGCRQRFAL